MSTRLDDTQLWQLWRPFVGIHRWFLARGCPPTIRRLRGMTRVLHVTVLTTSLGLMTGIAHIVISNFIIVLGQDLPDWFFSPSLGVIHGMLFLVPISRWYGRSWGWSATSILWAVLVMLSIDQLVDDLYSSLLSLIIHPPEDDWTIRTDHDWNFALHWAIFGTCWSECLILWMTDLRKLRSITALGMALPAGLAAYGASLIANLPDAIRFSQSLPIRSPGLSELLGRSVVFGLPWLAILGVTAVALGFRLCGGDQAPEATQLESANPD